MKIIRNWFRKRRSQSFIFRSEKVLKDIDNIVEKANTDYAFMIIAAITSEDIVIEIKIDKAEQCSFNSPKIFVNGKDMEIPYLGDISVSIRKGIEQYQLNKI